MDITILLASELLWTEDRISQPWQYWHLRMDSSLMEGCPMHCRYQAVTAYEPLEPEAPPNLHAGVSVKKKNTKKRFQTSLSWRTTPTWLHLYSVAFPSHSCHGADPSISLGPQAPRVLKSWLTILAHLCGQPHKTTGFFP